MVLVRPPSHHATKSRGMGGCLVNSIACAAHYALTIEGVGKVGVLDFDAHHGNGIANCVEEDERIIYVSLHELNGGGKMGPRAEYDPRGPEERDTGSLGNIKNMVLKKGDGWETYEKKLQAAIRWLQECDVLIVAAGFDSVKEDNTSGLLLESGDYERVGEIIAGTGKKVVAGLEGGYTHTSLNGGEGVLGDCVSSFVKGLAG